MIHDILKGFVLKGLEIFIILTFVVQAVAAPLLNHLS